MFFAHRVSKTAHSAVFSLCVEKPGPAKRFTGSFRDGLQIPLKFGANKNTTRWVVFLLAEKEGFEPSRPFAEPTPLAGEPLTATWVLLQYLAEREGFEPPVPCGITGFQDQRHQPLGHLSTPDGLQTNGIISSSFAYVN